MSNPQLEIITIEPPRDDHNANLAGTEGSHCKAPSGTTKNGNDHSLAVGLKHRHEKHQRNSGSTLVDIELDVAHHGNSAPLEHDITSHSDGSHEHQNAGKMNLPVTNSNPSTILSSAISSSSQTNLVRKHSCGDLVSRLKSRKILGVGENSEHRGEVYRSKISQLLGHSEHLFIRFPLAFWHWYACLILMHVLNGLWNLFGHLFLQRQNGTHESDNSSDKLDRVTDLLAISTFFRQFCGILYLVLATLLWRFYRINDKGLIRYILLICSAFSLAKIILMLYYDHCNVIELKNWLISLICSSKCTQDLSLDTSVLTRSCSFFTATSSHIIASYELTIYLVCDSIEMLVNLWYRHKMANNPNSGSSSLLAAGVIGGRRVSAHQAASTCEYASFFFNTYLLDPIARLFRPSSENQQTSTTPNISVPASPTTLKSPEKQNIPEESEEVNDTAAEATGAETKPNSEHHHQQ